jgi:hypothetical protein
VIRIAAGLATVVALLALVAGILFVLPGLAGFIPVGSRAAASPVASPSPELSPTPIPSPSPSPSPIERAAAFKVLGTDLSRIASRSGVRASVSLIELGGNAPTAIWSIGGDVVWPADSTYKLPLLMAEAAGIASGQLRASDKLCYRSSDFEVGWYDDYVPGECFTRALLAQRVGQKSDNTAAHILVRYLGGSQALNAFARSMGAKASKFFLTNTTTSSDLARLWASEATGLAGGSAAQKWLYPLITNTYWEAGIPAGTKGKPVVHKVGYNGQSINDAALVVNGPHGAYVLVVCSKGPGGSAGWNTIASLASRVWQFEATRP